ncbi:MAG: hypothetical protein ABIM40_04375 [Pseudomonadota bacterium]
MGLGRLLGLKKEFAGGTTPKPGELRGRFAVRLITGVTPDIRFFGHRKFFPPDVEQTGGGYNEFLGHIRLGDFSIAPVTSALGDGQEVLHINYNRPGNPFWIKPLNDELKKVAPGRYLGRGVLRLGPVKFNSFYFSLEKEED